MASDTLSVESPMMIRVFRYLKFYGSAVGAIIGLIIGIVLFNVFGTILETTTPRGVTVSSIAVIQSTPGSIDQALMIDMHASPALNCVRTSTQLLYKDSINKKRYYYPLGSSLNGQGFSGSTSDFVIVASLPTGLEPGDYMFIQRSLYICSWLHGFIARRIPYQTEPELVRVGIPK